jgi:peptide/nickel transport system substrate-binding protein
MLDQLDPAYVGRCWRRRGAAGRLARPVALMAAAALLAACGGANGRDLSEGQSGGVLRIGVNAGPLSLDPAKDGTGTPSTVRSLAYEPLMYFEADGNITPALATKWGYTDKSFKTFEFTLREDAMFSDGTKVDAQAVKGWFDYFKETAGPTVALMGLDSAEAVDDHTVRMRLAAPNPIVPQLLSDWSPWGAVASPKAVVNPDGLATDTDGAGPYMLDEGASVEGDHYTYVPNPHYFDADAVELDRVEVKVIADPNSMLQSIKAGQLDTALGDPVTAASAEAASLRVVSEDSGSTGFVILDREGITAPPLGDVRVRQAMNYAIDRAAIAKALVGEFGSASSEQQTADGFDPAYQDYYDYDPDKARRLLAEAGYADGFTVKVLSQGASGSLGDPVARTMAKYLQEVGIKLDITTGGSDFFTKVATGDYPMIQMLMGNSFTWVRYQYIFAPGGFFNVFKAQDEGLDRIVAELTKMADLSATWVKMSHYWTEQAFFVPALITQGVWYVAEGFEGVTLSYQRNYPSVREWHRS